MRRHPKNMADLERLKESVSIAALIGETLELQRDGKRHQALCPFHSERTPSFYVFENGYHCFGCGERGDVFDWLLKTRRMTFKAAMAYLSGDERQDRPTRLPQVAKPAQPRHSATPDTFLRLWREGVDPGGTVVETYLRSRGGLWVPENASIRFHPRCQRGPRDLDGGPEYWPAMLALMTDPITAQPVGLHRTYLQPDGSGKAPITVRGPKTLKAKMILGTWGVVRLAPDEEIGRAVGIAEGIENALTAMQAIGWGPTWAAGTADGIKNLPILPGIEAVTIFADADDSGVGLAAARACATRWQAAGREALIHVPPEGQEWNDAARRMAA